ncbi:hypothetical protein D3C72_1204600 [compost metagenome]
MHIVLKIAVKPQVKKYITYKHNTSPFVLTKNNKYGMFLRKCIVRLNDHKKESTVKLDSIVYSEELCIRISEDMWRRIGNYIHPQNQIDFNSFVEMDLQDEFFKHCDNAIYNKIQIKRSIYDFLDKYDITEDELPFKTMEKQYYREKKKINRPNIIFTTNFY